MQFDPAGFAIIAAVFAVAGMVKGAIGLGLPTVSMALMSVWVAPAEAALILVLPAILTNIWQVLNGPYFIRVMVRLWPMLLMLTVMTTVGTGVITGGRNALTVSLLGAMVMLFALVTLSGLKFSVPVRAERVLGPVAGGVTGLITGATAIFVIPSVPYIQALDLEKTEFIQAVAATALTATFGLAIGLAIHGHFSATAAAAPGAIATVGAFAGMAFGTAVRERMPVDVFRRWVLVGLACLGGAMIINALL